MRVNVWVVPDEMNAGQQRVIDERRQTGAEEVVTPTALIGVKESNGRHLPPCAAITSPQRARKNQERGGEQNETKEEEETKVEGEDSLRRGGEEGGTERKAGKEAKKKKSKSKRI